jgi:hypothetical protein
MFLLGNWDVLDICLLVPISTIICFSGFCIIELGASLTMVITWRRPCRLADCCLVPFNLACDVYLKLSIMLFFSHLYSWDICNELVQ